MYFLAGYTYNKDIMVNILNEFFSSNDFAETALYYAGEFRK